MKSYNEFITEAKAHADTIIKAVNKKAKSFDDLDDKERKKIIDLYKEKERIRKLPGAKDGKQAKPLLAIDKKIDAFASKYGMSMDDLQAASIKANEELK
ncbi:hypothetical protein fHeYen901_137 [Yersinia phage fHe-Yen9-01]|uniref:Uncharacterized protein n=1 Tax=Yersinia phage fHe-Yen9-01 TaxID=1965363 RepID=A0A1V0DXN7_9CAUD|nr:internal virion protein [Yersinia phage fHe-Yen9-01]ARB05910.1 hypothetical protein fHeYen901_137 [Yersinia phage fHe-Yen9-01]